MTAFLSAHPALRRWGLRLICLVSGALTSLAFPPVDCGNLVWLALLPLLSLLWLGPRGFKRGFGYGWLWGMGMFTATNAWITEVGHVFFIPSAVFCGIAFLPLMAFFSLYPALWAGIANTLLRPNLEPLPECVHTKAEAAAWAKAALLSGLRAAVGCGALWVCTEWLRAHGTLGYSWNSLGMALYGGLSMVQWAEFVGTAALSFIPVATAVVLWCAMRRTWIQFRRFGSASRPWDFYGTVILLFCLFAGGLFLSARYAADAMLRRKNVLPLPVAAVQINLDQNERISEGSDYPELYGLYLRATKQAFDEVQRETVQRALQREDVGLTQQLPLWVIWPESALGCPLFRHADTGELLCDPFNPTMMFGEQALPMVREQVQAMGGQPFVLFTGGDEVLLREDAQGMATYAGMKNSLLMVPGDMASITTVSKQHLMPFGEYVPFVEHIEWIGKIYSEMTGTQVGEGIHPGEGSEPLAAPVPGTGETVGVIPAVCYEDSVGDLVAKFVRKGPQVIVNVTNDGWFRRSVCGEQQARNAAFRCIELRRPMVRAANMGLTCAIAPNGAVIDELTKADGDPHTAGYSYAVLPVDREAGLTLYALLGDWAVVLCALLALLCMRRKRA
ncbi:MAG: apolipoprotein N-acyltransferase [Akkermansia sp.]|nr:apolipoprotein N-acyltransferase [Akkermansia sp.]